MADHKRQSRLETESGANPRPETAGNCQECAANPQAAADGVREPTLKKAGIFGKNFSKENRWWKKKRKRRPGRNPEEE